MIDTVNPRAENNFGQIVRWRYENADHTRPVSEWHLFVGLNGRFLSRARERYR
jgi:secreted PhoX family phosphatase